MPDEFENAITGCLLGTAVGDALGLPLEGLSRRRAERLYPDISTYHLLFGRGMVSDDTEHAALVACALAASAGEPEQFGRILARELKWWLACLPAGVGLATLRALLKLWVGFSSSKSGVFSAGNGPAMRSPVIGVCCRDNLEQMKTLVRISTRLTHTDPKAEYGALAAALAAGRSSLGQIDPAGFVDELSRLAGAEAGEFLDLVSQAADSAAAGDPTSVFADSLGLSKGISGYVYHTMPASLHAWFLYPHDLTAALGVIIRCGGDADTTAAITGGIVGAAVGSDGIPDHYQKGLWNWPATVPWLTDLGHNLADAWSTGRASKALRFPFWKLALRNPFFTVVVLSHGFRRLLPPY